MPNSNFPDIIKNANVLNKLEYSVSNERNKFNGEIILSEKELSK